MRIRGQATIDFRLRSVMQNVNHTSATNAPRIVDACIREIGMLAELLGAAIRLKQHVLLGAEVQAACWARFDARWFEIFRDAVGAQRALEHAMRLRIHLRNVEWASGDAVAAADAIGLLE